jgi:hypothetical protein
MRVTYATTGSLLVQLPDESTLEHATDAAATALGVRLGFVRLNITECSVVVLQGKLLCHFCDKWLACTCGALDEAQCRCEALESSDVCDCCNAAQDGHLEAEEAAEDARQEAKDGWLSRRW